MKKSRSAEGRIIMVLGKAKAAEKAKHECRRHGIFERTLYGR